MVQEANKHGLVSAKEAFCMPTEAGGTHHEVCPVRTLRVSGRGAGR